MNADVKVAGFGSVTRKLVGLILLYPVGGAYINKLYKYQQGGDFKDALVIPEGEYATSHIFKAGQQNAWTVSPHLALLIEETTTIGGTPSRISYPTSACVPTPQDAERKYAIKDVLALNEYAFKKSPVVGDASQGIRHLSVNNTLLFDDVMKAQKFLNNWLSTNGKNPAYGDYYRQFGVVVAFVYPEVPAQTIKKLVID